MSMFADPSNFELGLPVVKLQTLYGVTYDAKIYRKYLLKVNEAYATNFRDNFLKFSLHKIQYTRQEVWDGISAAKLPFQHNVFHEW